MAVPTEVRTSASDVLVIGAGGAGLRAAIAATAAGRAVTVVGKRARRDAHTVLAAGGINAALGTVDPEDSWQQHFADTFRESYRLADPRIVEIMTSEAPAAVQELADWGCGFARLPDGRLDQRFFGAHKYRRTCFAGDHTGKDIVKTLVAKAEEVGVEFVDHQYVSGLLLDDGECAGAFAFDLSSGERTAFLSGATLLATGGHTSLWHRNTSRADENHGEGMAMALRAGCHLMDMELVQFHPTGIVAPQDVAGTLVTEAVRGEGGRLFNGNGERFMTRYDPVRMELSTRDRVALANYTEIVEGRGGPHGGVFLDISHLGKDYILERLPRMYKQFQAFQGLDISKEPMEVAPTAHYSMGGIVVEPQTHATNVGRLFAAGECAAGLHGANRLGGNSLVDILVFGRRAGEAAASAAAALRTGARASVPAAAITAAGTELDSLGHPDGEPVAALQRRLREVMWERCGVVRAKAGLREGLRSLGEIEVETREAQASEAGASRSPGDYAILAHALDLRAALLTARATIVAAIERRETRGAHNRSDFPSLDRALEVNFHVAAGDDGPLRVWPEPVPPVPEALTAWVDSAEEYEADGRLLE